MPGTTVRTQRTRLVSEYAIVNCLLNTCCNAVGHEDDLLWRLPNAGSKEEGELEDWPTWPLCIAYTGSSNVVLTDTRHLQMPVSICDGACTCHDLS